MKPSVQLTNLLTFLILTYRFPYSSFVTVSVELWGSERLLQLRYKPGELRLSRPPRLRLSPGIRSPPSSPPWCLSPLRHQQQLQCPGLHLLPPPQHSRSITSQYVPLSFTPVSRFYLWEPGLPLVSCSSSINIYRSLIKPFLVFSPKSNGKHRGSNFSCSLVRITNINGSRAV